MSKKRIIIEVDDNIHQKIKTRASIKRMTIKEAMMRLINRWLERK